MQNAKLQSIPQNFKRIKKELPGIQKNISLAKYATFRIGGPAKYFFSAEKKEDIIRSISVAKKFNLPFFILGGGSNILVSDQGFNGLIIKAQNAEYKILNTKIAAEAGTMMSQLVNVTVSSGLSGLEWAAGIPGTIGGAVYGNAGAFGESMEGVVKEVEVLDIKTERIKKLKNKDCKFGYRDSVFKKNPRLIILSVLLKFKEGNKKAIKEKIKDYLNCREEKQPLNFPSAGSVFRNPVDFSAGELIERCGLKGKRVGNVKISEKHANFIVNLGRGTAKDVARLIKIIKNKVKKKSGVGLEEEIRFLGF